MSEHLLTVSGLRVALASGREVLKGISLNIAAGEIVALVGESGAGKSTLALALLAHARRGARISAGQVLVAGQALLGLQGEALRQARGALVGYVPQDPAMALNPARRIGSLLLETLRAHQRLAGPAEQARLRQTLVDVGLPDDAGFLRRYAHQLSGGQQQRLLLALAFVLQPRLIVLDEPTTALDVTIQAQILDLMKELQAQTGMAIIFITHDLGVVAELCDEVVVMYAGRAVERADIYELFDHPRHPYTHGLMASIPRLEDVPKSLLKTIKGQVPALHEMPAGCRFSNRCPHATPLCVETIPVTEQLSERHGVACHHWKEVSL